MKSNTILCALVIAIILFVVRDYQKRYEKITINMPVIMLPKEQTITGTFIECDEQKHMIYVPHTIKNIESYKKEHCQTLEDNYHLIQCDNENHVVYIPSNTDKEAYSKAYCENLNNYQPPSDIME